MTQEELKKEFADLGLDLAYIVDNDKPEDIDELMEKLEELVRETEVIYYATAMEYLSENDPSLQFSFGLAHDMGCTLENLNSETLATLHLQDRLMSDIWTYKDELEEAFYND